MLASPPLPTQLPRQFSRPADHLLFGFDGTRAGTDYNLVASYFNVADADNRVIRVKLTVGTLVWLLHLHDTLNFVEHLHRFELDGLRVADKS